MITFFNIAGAMIYLDESGRQTGYEDVFSKIDMCRAHYAATGLGTEIRPINSSVEPGMPWGGILAVGGGARSRCMAALVAGHSAEPLFPDAAAGTLAANLVGGLLMGFAMELLTPARDRDA
jgi:hypothetical protein